MISLIKEQINLSKVKIYEDDEPYAQGRCKRIGNALITKSSIIKELDIGNSAITFPPLLLENFQNNLTTFKFGINYEVTEELLADELESVLKNISIPNLQQLIIYKSCPFSIIAKIVEKTKGDLRKINIGASYSDEYADILISCIAKHCPKLEYLMVWISSNMKELIELYKKCKQLRGLVLHFLGTTYFERDADEILKELCDNVSKQLRKFKLIGNWKISKKNLEKFFDNWKKQERNRLDFYIYKSYILQDDYDDIIKKYKGMGVIGDYKYDDVIAFDASVEDSILDGLW